MPGGAFVNVGERTNVTGSRQFARLMLGIDGEGATNGAATKAEDEAVAIARDQVANGAVILDVNMDEAMLDGVAAMTRYLRRLGSEPDIAAVPGHGRQLQVVGDRGRAAAAPGPPRRELDLAQGGRGRVPAPGEAVPPLRRRRRS